MIIVYKPKYLQSVESMPSNNYMHIVDICKRKINAYLNRSYTHEQVF